MWHACKQRAFALFGLQKCCPNVSRAPFGVSKKEQKPVTPRNQDPSRFATCYHSTQKQNSLQDWESTCDGHSKNKYQHLHCSQWLETLSWVGTAFAIGLNYKLCSKARKCSADKQRADLALSCFCTATQSLLRLALLMPGQFGGTCIKKNTLSLESSSKQSLPGPRDSSGYDANSSPHFSQDNASLVNESVKILEGATREYFAELENLAGLQLITTHQSEAFSHFLTASTLGSTKGHFNAGICYDTGQGTAVDYEKAAHHFTQASDAGHSYAAYNLGLYYLEGRKGVDIQPDIGLQFLRKASDLGIANAQYYLGLCYRDGWEVERNVDVAKELFQKAAQTGHKEALNAMAGLPKDEKLESSKVKFCFDLPGETLYEEELDLKQEVGQAPHSPTTFHLSASSPDLLTEKESSENVPERMLRTYEIDISRYLNVILPYHWISKHSEETLFNNGDITSEVPVNSVVTICL